VRRFWLAGRQAGDGLRRRSPGAMVRCRQPRRPSIGLSMVLVVHDQAHSGAFCVAQMSDRARLGHSNWLGRRSTAAALRWKRCEEETNGRVVGGGFPIVHELTRLHGGLKRTC
jgi:hypothetical protein